MEKNTNLLIYLGTDKHFANNLKQIHQNRDIAFIHFESAPALMKQTKDDNSSISSAHLLIDSDLELLSGLSLAFYLAQLGVEHLGTMILSEKDEGHEIAVISDYFIERCNCSLSSGEKREWEMIYQSFAE